MRHFFRAFFSLLSAWQWKDVPPWSKADSEQMTAFLKSRAGIHLAHALRNASIQINARAVQNGGTAWECGQAAGWQQCAAYLQTLSATWEPELPGTDEDGEPEGADAFLERMSP